MLKRRLTPAFIAAALAWPFAASAGFQWSEGGPGGAGDGLTTAQVTYSATYETLDRITGALTTYFPDINSLPVHQVDLYKIRVSDVSTFSARTLGQSTDDTQLYLIDKDGKGVYTNDDNGGIDFLSLLPAGGLPGLSTDVYYLAIAIGGYLAQDASGASLFMPGDFNQVLAGDVSSGPLAGWSTPNPNFSDVAYSYQIELTGATNAELPEPGVFALAAVALGAAGIARRRKHGAARA